MRLNDFRALIERLKAEVPPAYLEGIVEVAVSAKAVPHPVRADVYTLGECIPVEWSGNGADLESRVVLYHGSFAALADQGDRDEFDWRHEAWETLTHELRHHLELRANTGALDAYDWAAEQNFARQEGDAFDPGFYREGERLAPGIFKVDDDVFMELDPPPRGRPLELKWHGRRYRAAMPAGARPPAFLTIDGLGEPPPGDAVVVLPRRFSVFSFFRRAPAIHAADIQVEDIGG
jgi:hypothetical protein